MTAIASRTIGSTRRKSRGRHITGHRAFGQLKRYLTNATYHPNGSLAGFTYGNGLIHSQTLNSRGLPNRIRDRTSGNISRLDYSYGYDKHGNITSIIDGVNGNENRTLSYDARDRMSGATAPNIYGQEIAEYDVLDNVRRLAGAPNGVGGYVQDYRYQYDTSQRLDRIDNEVGALQWDFAHNGFGETTTRSGHNALWSYQWNAAGRMTQASRNGTARPYLPFAPDLPPVELDPSQTEAITFETYVYDAHGHRTRSSRSDGSSRYQVYSRAGQLLYIEDTKDNQRIDYLHLGGKLIAQRSRPLNTSTATVTYHHTDHIQSANVETNAVGTQTRRTIRTPYGSPYDGIYREGPGYAGHVTDTQTDLTYMQQRYYDPVALRFLSPDPVDVSASDGGNFNRYWYGNNNPYRFVDPDGREACPGAAATRCIQADTFDASRGSGQTVVASPAIESAMVSGKNVVAVRGGGGGRVEKMAFIRPTANGSLAAVAATGVTTTSDSRKDTASAAAPSDAVAVLHGHIDGRSDGVVSPADAKPLKSGLPNGVVSAGRVGVTEIVDGRLQFRMISGRMTSGESRKQQKSLNTQQEEFKTSEDDK